MVPFTDMVNQAADVDQNQTNVDKNERALALNKISTYEDLDFQIKSMMEKSENDAVK